MDVYKYPNGRSCSSCITRLYNTITPKKQIMVNHIYGFVDDKQYYVNFLIEQTTKKYYRNGNIH